MKLHQFAKFSRLTYLTFCLAFREAMLNLPYQNKETEVTRSVILPHPFALHCNQLVVHFKSQPLIYSLVKYHRHLPPKPGLFAHQIRNLFKFQNNGHKVKTISRNMKSNCPIPQISLALAILCLLFTSIQKTISCNNKIYCIVNCFILLLN